MMIPVAVPRTAMVLAAGLGVRMRPLTLERPKPLLEIAGRSLLDHALDRLAEAGVETAVVNCHYKAEMIAARMAERTHPRIILAPETELLETGGAVRDALPLLGQEPFFVINADILWLDGPVPALVRLADAWNGAQMDALLLMMSTAEAFGYHGPGDYHMDFFGRLRRRPPNGTASHVYAGVQITQARAFAGMPAAGPFSNNLVWTRAEQTDRLHGIGHDGSWYHIGTPDALYEARRRLEPSS